MCFKYGDDDFIKLRIPTKDDETGSYLPEKNWETKDCDADDVLGILCDLEEMDPASPSFLILLNKLLPIDAGSKFAEICPVGLIDDEDYGFIDLEGLCDAYKMAPCSPESIEGQPPIILEILKTIRSEKNKYEVIKMESARREAKKK